MPKSLAKMLTSRVASPFVNVATNLCIYCEARADSVCGVVETDELRHLMAAARKLRQASGEIFIEEGQRADAFYNITHGTVRLSKLLPDGRRQITGFAERGDFLGLAVVETYGYSAEAIGEVHLCHFTRGDMQDLLRRFPAMEKHLLARASAELALAQDQMLLLGRKTARERLASFLLGRQRLCPGSKPSRRHIQLPMGRSDIADYLGLTIETVSRTFTRLRGQRLIDLPSTNEILILDQERLENLAAGLS
ncbi:CRP/FNR family transcriptional regulator, anaerobic regulatory protein [Arboricoccus pini]|uniref:CRP/FNR family transcriptional regulator, anaerobic regulatory protein n=1 Tax=Arboricoccus pini TaxID=1963835 RepID=A0A212RS42_9PROT|nr:helix-turn-helix domain-containing protein [Arboricoccus pini]SNB75422.1 CRP/FNR family transcriptional regulator, anaerobic regulatory protein [Arboricoccus pini]